MSSWLHSLPRARACSPTFLLTAGDCGSQPVWLGACLSTPEPSTTAGQTERAQGDGFGVCCGLPQSPVSHCCAICGPGHICCCCFEVPSGHSVLSIAAASSGSSGWRAHIEAGLASAELPCRCHALALASSSLFLSCSTWYFARGWAAASRPAPVLLLLHLGSQLQGSRGVCALLCCGITSASAHWQQWGLGCWLSLR